MAHLHNFARRQRSSSWLSTKGNKIRNVAEFAGTAHGLYHAARQPIRDSKPWVQWWQLLDCDYNIAILLIYNNAQ